MSFLPGGDTDKRGNYYENKYVVSKFAELLSGKLLSVQQETYIQSEESGVDVIIKDKNGIKSYCQCKARNGINDSWSISDLITTGVITKAFSHTRKGINFVFTTPLSVSLTLKDFCDRAGAFTDLSTFEGNALGGDKPKKEYEKIKLNIQSHNYVTDEEILSFFQRLRFEAFPDDELYVKNMLSYKAQVCDENHVYDLLCGYVESKKSCPLKLVRWNFATT